MSHARLLSVEVTRFKSYQERTRLDLKPLTVLVGRNNSGKSTMVQALLLLKQTLENPRTDVPLHLVGTVEALSLRELTHGWPESLDNANAGPTFALELESRLDIDAALASTIKTTSKVLIANGIVGLKHRQPKHRPKIRTRIALSFGSDGRRTILTEVSVISYPDSGYPSLNDDISQPSLMYSDFFHVRLVRVPDGNFAVFIGLEHAGGIGVEWDHFIPHLTLDRSGLGSRDADRIRHNLWLFRCQQPLEDLRTLLRGFGFLGSTRSLPPTLYRVSASEPPETVGASGEYAAEILHARRDDVVHYLRPVAIRDNLPTIETTVRARPLVDAVNDVFTAMGLKDRISIEDVKDVGFRLLFGKATLQHVGRGLTYLLPLVEYGLLLDPKHFDASTGDTDRDAFLASLTSYSLAAMEEPEAHIHPKLQTHLAQWFVALAMCGRNLIVETHSDHFVRRLRRLIARAPKGGVLETWLRENVEVVEVSQDEKGNSTLVASALTEQGDFERWPADFMDVATDEEREIYDAALDKPATISPTPRGEVSIIHDEGEEPEEP
jgi:predicted ATPase